jgi:tetratricopeptide (TPR) repeat protein
LPLPAAIAREQQALELDPLSEELGRRLGFFLVANRELPRAWPQYEKALAIAPASDRARFNLADFELLDGDAARALDSYDKVAIEARPDQAVAHYHQ